MGTEQIVIICAPAPIGQAPCGSGKAPATVTAYLIDPVQAPSINAQNAPFDYAAAATIWGLAFTFVVGLYLISKSAGVILAAIRNF
ncbi:hypothetical protein LXA47_19235 [Massilia sp. P8910]|uniref:hypothetical protein n=1 Tax=Massilia antarctica TaxID=2765360 RepID=UPI001E3AA1BD|nr:hypothetical protein [Massilia antarctica]MCE3605722.1 hypothetical protein [Massilia antarctica]